MQPLLGVEHGPDWVEHVALDGMASFLLVLATPDRLTTWDFDGAGLAVTEHAEGTWLLTSGGPEDRKADRWLPAFSEAVYPEGWRTLVAKEPPQDDPGALVVRLEVDEALPGGLAVYGARFGRYPLDPTVVFVRK